MGNKKVLTPPSGKPVPVRIPGKLQEKVDEGSQEMEMPAQHVIRIALDVGLTRLKKIGWKIAEAIDDAADRASEGPAESPAPTEKAPNLKKTARKSP